MTKVTEGEQRDRLTRERVGQVHTNSGDVPNVSATRLKVNLIAVESLCHARWLAVTLVGATAGEGLCSILCLPEVQSATPVCVLEVVGVRDSLGPVAAFPVRNACYPRTRSDVAPVT